MFFLQGSEPEQCEQHDEGRPRSLDAGPHSRPSLHPPALPAGRGIRSGILVRDRISRHVHFSGKKLHFTCARAGKLPSSMYLVWVISLYRINL